MTKELYSVWHWSLPQDSAGVAAISLLLVVLWQWQHHIRVGAWTWVFAAIQCPVGIWAWDLEFGVPRSPLKFYVTVFFLLVPARALYRSSQRDIQRNQDRRDVQADRIVQAPDGRFALYLRAFSTTGRLASQPYVHDQDQSLTNGSPPEHLDAEQVMRLALDRRLPLIAAGRPDDLRGGAGRLVLPSENWRPIVAELARRAELVLIMPSANPGTLWEMRWLRQYRRFEGTVFLMPEQQNDDGIQRTTNMYLGKPIVYSWDTERYFRDHAADWAEAVTAAAEAGISLPPYRFDGAMFTLNEDGTVRKLVGLDLMNRFRRVRRLRAGLAELTGPTTLRELTGLGSAPEAKRLDDGAVFRPRRVRHALGALGLLIFGTAMFGQVAYGFFALGRHWYDKVLGVPFGGAAIIWASLTSKEVRVGGEFAVGPGGIRIADQALLLPWSDIEAVKLRSTPNGWFVVVHPTVDAARPERLWNEEINALVVASLRRVHAEYTAVVGALRKYSGGRFIEVDVTTPVATPSDESSMETGELSWHPGRVVIRTAAVSRVMSAALALAVSTLVLAGWFWWMAHVHSLWHLLATPLLAVGLYEALVTTPQLFHGARLQFDASGVTYWPDSNSQPTHHPWHTVDSVQATASGITVTLASGVLLWLDATPPSQVRQEIAGYAAERCRAISPGRDGCQSDPAAGGS